MPATKTKKTLGILAIAGVEPYKAKKDEEDSRRGKPENKFGTQIRKQPPVLTNWPNQKN